MALPNHLYYSNAGCGSCYEVKCVAPSTLPFIIGGVEGGNACKTDKSIIVYASDRCPVSTFIQLGRLYSEVLLLVQSCNFCKLWSISSWRLLLLTYLLS